MLFCKGQLPSLPQKVEPVRRIRIHTRHNRLHPDKLAQRLLALWQDETDVALAVKRI